MKERERERERATYSERGFLFQMIMNEPCTRKERVLKRMDMQIIFLSIETLVIITVRVKERVVDSER